MLDATNLPQPSAGARAVSDRLSECICAAIAEAGGHIGFEEYMRMALYEPGLGYYLAGAVKFGAQGDFVTAPEISPLFGASIARQCDEVLTRTGGDILEFGAGSGLLAAQVLTELAKSGGLPQRYKILELSPDLRERQRLTLAKYAPALADRVEWITNIPSVPVDGVVLANEIVDALPVKVFRTVAGQIYERRVQIRNNQMCWQDVHADQRLQELVRGLVEQQVIESDVEYVSEINIGIVPWIADLSRSMNHTVALIIDYGFVRTEYFHRSRVTGTLMCHFRHRWHDDPFWFPGLQDITASVDFTAIAEAADLAELRIAGFAEQGKFLLACGLLDDAKRSAELADDARLARLAYETKVLTLPTEMGTRFKVLALAKGYNFPLSGFQPGDDRHRL